MDVPGTATSRKLSERRESNREGISMPIVQPFAVRQLGGGVDYIKSLVPVATATGIRSGEAVARRRTDILNQRDCPTSSPRASNKPRLQALGQSVG